MTADWPQIDSTVSLHASNDLFGGDFFGDELNDMYISGASDIGGLQEPAAVSVNGSNTTGTTTPPSIEHGLDSIAFTDFTDLMPQEATVSPISVADSGLISLSPTDMNQNPNKRQTPATNNFGVQIPSVAPLHASTMPQQTLHTMVGSSIKVKRAPLSTTVRKSPPATDSSKSIKNPPTAQNIQGQGQLNANDKNTKGKKNAHTPNPLSSGNVIASGAVVSPLPGPTAFVPAPVPVTNCIQRNMQVQSASNRTNVTSTPEIIKSLTNINPATIIIARNKPATKTQVPKKQSSSTIYAPSRQMCTPSVTLSSSVTKNANVIAPTIHKRTHNNPNALATAAAASAQPTGSSDFAAVAQAAVTNLILNAGNQSTHILHQKNHVVSDHDEDSDRSTTTQQGLGQRKIDTSTAHVTALTSPNWVAACASMTSTIPGTSVTAPIVSSNHLPTLEISSNDVEDETPAAKRRRLNLNPEERAKQNRDRNREHARNTRLRKKAYVEELKRTLTELVAQRDASDLERRRNSQRELEQREVRFRVMEELLKLRGSNEPNVARWVAILEDGFTLTLPFTNYRSVVKGVDANAKLTRQVSHEQNSNEHVITSEDKQVLYGAPECMADATALGGLLSGIGKGIKTNLIYECDRKRFLMDGTNAVLEWSAQSVGISQDANTPVLKSRGSMKASFSPASNKLISCELCFDTSPIVSQVKKQFTPSFPIHDDFAANIFGGGSGDADRLLDSLEMPMLPGQLSLSHGVPSQKSLISSEREQGTISQV